MNQVRDLASSHGDQVQGSGPLRSQSTGIAADLYLAEVARGEVFAVLLSGSSLNTSAAEQLRNRASNHHLDAAAADIAEKVREQLGMSEPVMAQQCDHGTSTTQPWYAPSPAEMAQLTPRAWDKIFRRYGELVATVVRSFRLQEADALHAVQMTWLRLAENAHRVQFPERLGGWLVTTARRECLHIQRLHILRQVKPIPGLIDITPDTVADLSVGPEQHVIEADTAKTLRKLVAELSPRRRTLVRMLFTDHPRSYAEVAETAGIPPGGIGPTRARVLRRLRESLAAAEAAVVVTEDD